jgi:hypothetical protein
MQRSTQKVSLIGVWSGLRRIFRELGEFMKNQMYFAVVAAIALSVVASGWTAPLNLDKFTLTMCRT